MPRVKALIEYDGTEYYGWQLQNGQRTIQGEIEQALKIVFKQNIRVTGSGRTDTGVHARGQVAHFDIPEFALTRLQRSLNGLLPEAIVIKKLEWCDAGFHARYDAHERRYRYYIARKPTALQRRYSWLVLFPLNLTLMQKGARFFTGVQDFRAFCKVKSEVKHHRCQVLTSRLLMENDLLIYEITANRFLHGMVRAIVGTLVALGNGKITLPELEAIAASGDRTRVPLTAPGKGLVLEEVTY